MKLLTGIDKLTKKVATKSKTPKGFTLHHLSGKLRIDVIYHGIDINTTDIYIRSKVFVINKLREGTPHEALRHSFIPSSRRLEYKPDLRQDG